ncbi:MAG: hypothetical protein ABIQ55_00645 [Gemmatimonadaceae bacterium]
MERQYAAGIKFSPAGETTASSVLFNGTYCSNSSSRRIGSHTYTQAPPGGVTYTQSGLNGSGRSLAAIGLVLSHSAVLYLSADLDRPDEGMLTRRREVIVDLRNTMEAPRP